MRDIKCACGCGETVPANNIKRNFLYVNEKHKVVKDKKDAYERQWNLINNNTAESRIMIYCHNYKFDSIDCIKCYENQAAIYRGCYEEPIIKKKQI